MTTLTQLLYDYAQNYRLSSFLDRNAADRATAEALHQLAALKRGLSSEQLAALEKYRSACRRRQTLEQEAMFLTGLSVARELL